MLDTDARRWAVAVIAALAIVALLAWARNDPGVGGREPDPPQSTEVVTDDDSIAPEGTTVVTEADAVTPTT